ncbi:MAG: hypothetical protein ABII82_13095 [Verrucomicrobiota bacterium]
MNMQNHQTRASAGLNAFIIIALIGLIAALIIPTIGKVPGCGGRSAEVSNLRQIGQAGLIYAADHQDRLPETDDLHGFMIALAKAGGMNSADLWFVHGDPLLKTDIPYATVLNAEGTALHDDLKDAPIGWAAVISGLHVGAGSTTPVAWTRGLQPDGTWSKDSPHAGEGGYIVFLGGNISAFTRSLADQPLRRYDGNGTTTNILEALPPGSRVGEWRPVAAH